MAEEDRAKSVEDELREIVSGRKGGGDVSGAPPFLGKVKEIIQKMEEGDKTLTTKDILRCVINETDDHDHLVLIRLPCPKGGSGHGTPEVYGANSGLADILEALNEAHYKYTRMILGQETGMDTMVGSRPPK